MEHVSSARPTGKFPEKVENLKRWARFPGWNLRTECRVPFTFLVVRTSFRSTVGHRDVPGFKTNGLQLITNRKFHFCSHRNFGVFFLNGKRPGLPFQNFRLSREFFEIFQWDEPENRLPFTSQLEFPGIRGKW